MGPGQHRPHDHEYWTRPWSTVLFAGDLFEAIPFGDQPTVVVSGDDPATAGKHFVGEAAFGYGLLVTPTCDMADQHGEAAAGHPFRVLVPVVPLDVVVAQTGAVANSANLLRSRDTFHPYLYLPALDGVLPESVACLFRPTLVSDDFLADPPRRVAQLRPLARRHLKVKLAGYWGRVAVDPEELPLHERGEDEARAGAWPPSRHDDPAGPLIDDASS